MVGIQVEREVLSLDVNDVKQLTQWTELGREFQNLGLATEKPEPNTVRVQGTTRVIVSTDRLQYLFL